MYYYVHVKDCINHKIRYTVNLSLKVNRYGRLFARGTFISG